MRSYGIQLKTLHYIIYYVETVRERIMILNITIDHDVSMLYGYFVSVTFYVKSKNYTF